ncbi:hypothetical protein SNE40_006217 [Patella caerulea]|uniref:Sulfotransferase domain-containing protein n=1 Tax=Patella caerulea TaxID=87958 RepID=A0AAN8JWC8_PATCE
MTSIKVADDGGDTVNVVEVDDLLLPPFPIEALVKLPEFKLRPDDVLVCAYPKSGTHWVWEITRQLQAGTTDLELVEKDDGMIELSLSSHFDHQPDPRTLNTHLPFDKLPFDIHNKKCKIIYLLRNPKDVSVSYFNHHRKLEEFYEYHGQWKNYLPMVFDGRLDYGSWFDYVLGWEKAVMGQTNLPILALSYEDLQEDPIKGITQIAKFLGKNYDDDLIKTVCEKCCFKQMKKDKGKLEVFNGEPIMYRKGEVGDWKNWFTVAQNDWFDHVYKTKMRDSNLKIRFTLDS